MRSIAKFLGQVVLIAASTVTTLSAWAAVPAKPTGTSPGTTTSPWPIQESASVTLSWGAVSGATKYGLGVVDVATGALVVNTDVIGKTKYTAGLQSGKSYRWNVNACNASACSTYTSLLYFQTPVPPKTLSSLVVTCDPTSVNEGGTSTCKAAANFSDGSTPLDVTSAAGLKLSSTTYAAINTTSGVVTTKAVPSDQKVTVSGSYSYNGGTAQSGYASLTIKDVPLPNFQLTVTSGGVGSGTISGTGLSCSGSTCTGSYASGSSVTLTAQAAAGSVFKGWSDVACPGVGVCTLTLTPPRVANVSINATFDSISWAVPFLKQKDYANIGESACGPTSVAMLLRYFYPNSGIDMPEIYHSGTQNYTYEGPASGYKNVSIQLSDPGLGIVDKAYRNNYNVASTAMVIERMENYLLNTWGIDKSNLSEDGVYAQIKNGPLLGRVWGHGYYRSDEDNWGHYLVIIGIDDRGTPSRSDDIIYVHDPYDVNWGSWDVKPDGSRFSGKNRAIPYSQFFGNSSKPCGSGRTCTTPWFREARQLVLPFSETAEQRQGIMVVDSGNNGIEGNSSIHRFDLDDSSKWTLYVGKGGDWYYPNAGESGRAARWTPKITTSGWYEISARYRANGTSSTAVRYDVYSPIGTIMAGASINQYSKTPAWGSSTIATWVYLSPGVYIKATGIAAGTNIDAIRLKLISR